MKKKKNEPIFFHELTKSIKLIPFLLINFDHKTATGSLINIDHRMTQLLISIDELFCFERINIDEMNVQNRADNQLSFFIKW